MQEKSTIKQKILQYLEFKDISLYSFYKESGVTRGVLTSPTGISEDNIVKFITWAADCNKEWLFGHSDTMITKSTSSNYYVSEPSSGYDTTGAKNPEIPLLPLDAFAGISSNTDYFIDFNAISERYVVPLFNGKGVDFLISIRGSSMYPKLNSGDVVACKFIKDRLFIQWNKVYVIDTASQGTMVKRLKKAASPDFITCRSDNKDYDEFDVPISDIRNMALVVGVIRLE
jgi:phage repressor protein C with HTH and peptisase S24 domain